MTEIVLSDTDNYIGFGYINDNKDEYSRCYYVSDNLKEDYKRHSELKGVFCA